MSRVFFVDRDLGKAFPAALAAAGIEVRPYCAVFARDDVLDEIWLAHCGRQGWIALTHDRSIGLRRRSPAAFPEVFASGVGLIILMGHRKTSDLADAFICSRTKVEAFLDRHPPPFIAKFYSSPGAREGEKRGPGRIEMIVSGSTRR